MSIQEINLSRFVEEHNPPEGAVEENILDTGNIRRVINYINFQYSEDSYEGLNTKISLLACSLCQARVSQSKYAYICDGLLSESLISVIKFNDNGPKIGLRVMTDLGISAHPAFRKETALINYLVKPRFRNGSSLSNTRFSHHLSNHFGKVEVMSKAAAYVGIGVGLISTAVLQFLTPVNPIEDPMRNTRASILLVGGCSIASAPFIDAIFKSLKEAP